MSNMRMFCTYCGKDFSRKEHLERHIPRHTNVKPYRCPHCNMSYSRKDLLQRHMTFHETRTQAESLPGTAPNAPGRTPIACQNCANAKTGCDKRVPCSRCAEKGLPCAARYARRSMKAAARAAQASAAFDPQPIAGHGFHPVNLAAAHGDVDAVVPGQTSPGITRSSPRMLSEYCLFDSHEDYTSRQVAMAGSLQLLQTSAETLNDFIPFPADFALREPNYQDILPWPEYPMDFDFNNSSNCAGIGNFDMSIPAFHQTSDISSISDPNSALSRRSTHTRCTSIGDLDLPLRAPEAISEASEGQSADESKALLAAESAWPLARCTSVIFSGACPRTALLHLESLEKGSQNESTWAPLEAYLDTITPDPAIWASIKPLTARTRDTMLAITQAFLHKALDIHRGCLQVRAVDGSSPLNMYNFVVLPPTKLLEFFLYSFVLRSSDSFSLFPMATLDPNELALRAQPSHLLLLLMVAQGAMTIPMTAARILAAGLTETCRISLFDLIEKNVELCADPLVLTCALLFTQLGAWSGDKWLMDIAMGQRGMYMSMLRHAGMLESFPLSESDNTELQWRAWLQHETQNRLLYNWVMLDQELSLFYDTSPLLSTQDLGCSLPNSESLWTAPNVSQWMNAAQELQRNGDSAGSHRILPNNGLPSLRELFHELLQGKLQFNRPPLSPQHLRLLLHPLQSLVCYVRYHLFCFRHEDHNSFIANDASQLAPFTRLEEVQGGLRKWREVAIHLYQANTECVLLKTSLILYHLVSLNIVSDFLEIEKLARRESLDHGDTPSSARNHKCISDHRHILLHCGQVFRLLRLIPPNRRPQWSAVAAYRATLILWADAKARQDPRYPLEADTDASPSRVNPLDISQPVLTPKEPMMAMPSGSGVVAIDQIPYEAQSGAPSWPKDWIAVLTRGDGTTMMLDKALDILEYGCRFIDEGNSTRIGDGIKRKLAAMRRVWSSGDMAATDNV